LSKLTWDVPLSPKLLETLRELTIVGFTGSDAEAHYTQNGTLVVTLSVATKDPGRTPTASGRAEQTGTGLFPSASRPSSREH
jgi:hypothetical protein